MRFYRRRDLLSGPTGIGDFSKKSKFLNNLPKNAENGVKLWENTPKVWKNEQNSELSINEEIRLTKRVILQGENSSPMSAEYSEEDLLANMVYFFLVFVLATVVVGVTAFGIREYTLSIRNKPQSADWVSDKEEEEEEVVEPNMGVVPSLLQKGPEFNKPTANGLLQESNMFSKVIDTSSFVYDFSSTSSRHTEGQEDSESVRKLEVIGDELSPGFTVGLDLFAGNETQFYTSTSKDRPTYGFKEMMEIRQSSPIEFRYNRNGEMIKLSEIVKFSVCLPCKRFATAWEVDKAITDLRSSIATMADPVLVVKMVCIAASHSILDNENYYLVSFNDFIENFIDSAAIFDVINDCKNLYLQVLVMEMAMVYCWSQWNFDLNSLETRQRVYHKFEAWNSPKPTLQTHHTVFRLLCNLKLGIHILPEGPIRKELDFRLQILFRECVKTSNCHEYMGFLPMLAQAVDLSPKQSNKYFFYDLLYVVVTQHWKCCMADCLQEQENTHLKALLQHGVWHHHDGRLRAKVNDIYQFLEPRFDAMRAWRHEVRDGRTLVSSFAGFGSSSSERPQTPGSWKYFH